VKRNLLLYTGFIALSLFIVAAILQVAPLLVPEGATAAPIASHTPAGLWAQIVEHGRSPLARLIIQLVVIVVAARVCGMIAARIGQPPVIGEIAAGIVLGPSLLGAMAPGVSAALFPAESLPTLQMLSQVGVLLFMFVIGVELDVSHLRGRARTAVAVSHLSIAVPFILGVLSSLLLYRHYAPAGVPVHAFALFLGIAMSITAFPVLARMLDERGLAGTQIGTTALTSAAIGDLIAWILLAFVVAITTSTGAGSILVAMVALSLAFVLLMVFVVRPALGRLLEPASTTAVLTKEHTTLVLAVWLASALVTELIGIHALFGAFVAGTIMPSDAAFRRILRERLETVSSVLLLPLFFAFTGLRTQIGLLDDVGAWLVCVAIIGVATLGKVGGTLVAARWTGLGWHESMTLGALMNTRGLMELIALNVGYDLGILSPAMFTMLVLMALATTAMTAPFLTLIDSWHGERAARPAGGQVVNP
jgi:Kef-type K+ transport system membrane component KefB